MISNDNDGIVHEMPMEDQREERDAIQREAVEIKHQQRERERPGWPRRRCRIRASQASAR